MNAISAMEQKNALNAKVLACAFIVRMMILSIAMSALDLVNVQCAVAKVNAPSVLTDFFYYHVY